MSCSIALRIPMSWVLLALPAVGLATGNPHELAGGRETIAPNDGWASVSTTALPNATTGGSMAAPERTVVVTTRNELVAALAYPDATPKLIYIQGTIDANVDAAGAALAC
jgi:pectate lyase